MLTMNVTKKWNLADLPIVPEKWQLIPRKAAKQQLAVIKKLAKSATEIVHAGDPDRVLLRSFYGIHLLQ